MKSSNWTERFISASGIRMYDISFSGTFNQNANRATKEKKFAKEFYKALELAINVGTVYFGPKKFSSMHDANDALDLRYNLHKLIEGKNIDKKGAELLVVSGRIAENLISSVHTDIIKNGAAAMLDPSKWEEVQSSSTYEITNKNPEYLIALYKADLAKSRKMIMEGLENYIEFGKGNSIGR